MKTEKTTKLQILFTAMDCKVTSSSVNDRQREAQVYQDAFHCQMRQEEKRHRQQEERRHQDEECEARRREEARHVDKANEALHNLNYNLQERN